jgi:hypothetical protein
MIRIIPKTIDHRLGTKFRSNAGFPLINPIAKYVLEYENVDIGDAAKRLGRFLHTLPQKEALVTWRSLLSEYKHLNG